MKNLKIFLISTITCFAITAEAGEKFTGFGVGVGLGVNHNEVNYSGFLAGSQSTKDDVVARLETSYGFNLSPQWRLTVGATDDLNKVNFGSVTYRSGGQQTVNAKMKNHISAYLAPGYLIHPDWLIYGKFGVHYAEGQYDDTATGSGTTRHHGIGWGLGVATALSDSLEGRVEVEQINYSREVRNLSSGKPQTSQVTLSAIYHF